MGSHAARLPIRVRVAIGKADDDFTDNEKGIIAEFLRRVAPRPG